MDCQVAASSFLASEVGQHTAEGLIVEQAQLLGHGCCQEGVDTGRPWEAICLDTLHDAECACDPSVLPANLPLKPTKGFEGEQYVQVPMPALLRRGLKRTRKSQAAQA